MRMRPQFVSLATILTALSIGIAAAYAQQAASTGSAQRTAQFKAAGRAASLTVYPAGLVGKPIRQVGDVVAMLLEQAGMQNLELDAPEFQAPAKADLDETARGFGDFVRANPPTTDYALFADFLGSHEKGFEEVRVVIVNRQGELVWQDRQTPTDADFKRLNPKEPMQCCMLVVERLRPVLGLATASGAPNPSGKIAKRWAEKTGMPSKTESDALAERAREFKKSAASSTLAIYPVRAGDETSEKSAATLAKLVNDSKLTRASTLATGPAVDVTRSMNQQKVLWDMARAVREYVLANKPDADYVLFAHYLMGTDAAGNARVGGVHFIVCDRAGQWVIVDFQNDHHADFNAINPKSREDCDRLVSRRLAGYCR